jgi:hypothetical protein
MHEEIKYFAFKQYLESRAFTPKGKLFQITGLYNYKKFWQTEVRGKISCHKLCGEGLHCLQEVFYLIMNVSTEHDLFAIIQCLGIISERM